jgi:hypothetical protein
MSQKNKACIFIVLSVMALSSLMVAQANPTLSLSFYKDNGYGMGNDINGFFTANAAVSQDVVRVEFYLDGQLVQNDTSAPFSWSFNTGNYTLGLHTIEATAFDSANQTATASATRNFVGFPLGFVVAIIAVIVVALVASLAVAIYKVKKHNKQKAAN